jgi:hypothetical protein
VQNSEADLALCLLFHWHHRVKVLWVAVLPIGLSLMEIGPSIPIPFAYVGLWLMLGPATFAGESIIQPPHEGSLRERSVEAIKLWLRYRPAEKLQTAFLSVLAVLGLAVLKLMVPGLWIANLVDLSPWRDLFPNIARSDFLLDVLLLLAALVLIVKTVMAPLDALGSHPIFIASRIALCAAIGYSVFSLMIGYCALFGMAGYLFALLMGAAIAFRF